MRKILIIGATSAIAQEVARLYAEKGAQLYLLGRHQERLETLALDLRLKGADQVAFGVADLSEMSSHETVLEKAWERFESVDVALIAYGSLPDQQECQDSFEKTNEAIRINFTSIVSWLTFLSKRFEKEGRGTIAVISSVAGDRGRGSNYVYGAAKGALTLFLQGLRNRLFRSGVNVLTIKPGFVDTPMTAHLPKSFLFAETEQVGRDIYRAIERRKDVIYTPKFWRLIMMGIRAVPARIFKRLSL